MGESREREHLAILYETIVKLKNADECHRFFEDLCTPIELQSMEQRFKVAICLFQNTVYSEIKQSTGASSATISRVRRAMLDDGRGGVMRQILQREGFDKTHEHEVEDGIHGNL